MAAVSAGGVVNTVRSVNAALLRPFRQQVDLLTVALALVLMLCAAGMWHITLERVEL